MTQVQVDMADPEFKGYALVLKSGADPTTGELQLPDLPPQAWLELLRHHTSSEPSGSIN